MSARRFCKRLGGFQYRKGVVDWIVAHPEAATALATMALVAVGLVIGGGQIAVVWHGISAMRRSGERRERERDRRHREAMDRHERVHRETMDRMADDRRESQERHREAMESLAEERRRSQERHREAMETIASQRNALEALIERTAPRAVPAE